MKIVLVLPWFGQFCVGGAEKEARYTAINLQKLGYEVEILTTCLKNSHANWNENYYPSGDCLEDSLRVRRFEVRLADHFNFNRVLLRIRLGKELTAPEEKIFVGENIHSPGLNEYLKKNGAKYDFIIYIPYLYGTTFDGAFIRPEKSLLIPCLHDENFARLEFFKKMFSSFRKVIFHTEAEEKLARQLYGLTRSSLVVLGEGVNTEEDFEKKDFKKRHRIEGEYLLFVGRKDEGKNLPLLLNYFENYKKIFSSDLKLVLVGCGRLEVPPHLKSEIIDLDYVSEEKKEAAYAEAFLVVQPSLNESFSLVLMEAWLAGVPVVVNGFCAVTKEHCLKSGGGLYFENFWEFAEAVNWFLAEDTGRRRLAANGRRYVLENFTWPKIMAKYKNLFESLK